eukprot:2146993-Heterocapsa_arctica.AAC.1
MLGLVPPSIDHPPARSHRRACSTYEKCFTSAAKVLQQCSNNAPNVIHKWSKSDSNVIQQRPTSVIV